MTNCNGQKLFRRLKGYVGDMTGILTPSTDRFGAIFPFFTDGDLANRFIAGANKPNWILSVQSGLLLLTIMLTLKVRSGVTHVIIDCNPLGQKPRGKVYPIDDSLIGSLLAVSRKRNPDE